jgi:hypothetical protein
MEVGPLVGPEVRPEVGPEVGPGACLTHASDPMTTCCRTASTTRRQRNSSSGIKNHPLKKVSDRIGTELHA